MLEYTCIYMNKQSNEYVRILNVSDVVPSSYGEVMSERLWRQKCIQNTVKNVRWSVLQKE